MTTNDELLTVVPSQEGSYITDDLTDDLDDVEGHGLREVVVGLSAAAVLTGGAASAASMSSSTPGEPLRTPGAVINTVKAVQGDVDAATSPTVASATTAANGAAATATTLAGQTTTSATNLAEGALADAGDLVDAADKLAAETITKLGGDVRGIAKDPAGAVNKATSPITARATNIADRTSSGLTKTVTRLSDTAGTAIDGAKTTAGSTLTVLQATVSDTSASAMQIVLGLQGSDADAGAKAQSRDAWVVAKVGNEVVGSGQWDGDSVTMTIESRHLGSPVTFTVGGQQDIIAPLTVHLSS